MRLTGNTNCYDKELVNGLGFSLINNATLSFAVEEVHLPSTKFSFFFQVSTWSGILIRQITCFSLRYFSQLVVIFTLL